MGGVGEKALLRFLSDRPNIKTVYLCLDSDQAGSDACSRLAELVPEGYTVHRLVPLFKDWNEVLQHRAEITDGKYIREAVYGLKEPPQEETVEIIRMSEVDTQTVEWLWEPYIPFGKVTIVQGNPGEGKTTFALRLAAACTNRKPFPHMAAHEPFNVIYQTAEDGLGDTIKPRLMEAEADLDRVLVIDESKQGLSLSDERIERAIRQTGARLIILDPIQAYMGEKTDMNRANEVRPMFRRLADVAERTGCAVILIGHLNKAAGGQSAYRGLGSIDFRAAARSVLLIGRVKREPNVRVIVHDKSSLAPEGKPVAFCLDPETGFSWIGEYDITADELLSGAGGNTATKTEQAEKLILDLLADGKELASEDIDKAAAEAGISARTVRAAKKTLTGALLQSALARHGIMPLKNEVAKSKWQNPDTLPLCHFATSTINPPPHVLIAWALSLKGEPMSNETNTRTATPTASPLTAQGTQQPVMVKRIGKTTYRVKLHFSETSKETMTDKIKRLILNDCAKEFEQSEKIS